MGEPSALAAPRSPALLATLNDKLMVDDGCNCEPANPCECDEEHMPLARRLERMGMSLPPSPDGRLQQPLPVEVPLPMDMSSSSPPQPPDLTADAEMMTDSVVTPREVPLLPAPPARLPGRAVAGPQPALPQPPLLPPGGEGSGAAPTPAQRQHQLPPPLLEPPQLEPPVLKPPPPEALEASASDGGAALAPACEDAPRAAPSQPLPPRGYERVDVLGRRRRYFSRAECALHNQPHDCWLIAHGKVYDVTSFVSKHPAGELAILRKAGTDTTVDFDFHSSRAKLMWAPLAIGFADAPVGGASCTQSGDCVLS